MESEIEKKKMVLDEKTIEEIRDMHTSGGLVEDDYLEKLKPIKNETSKSYLAIADLFLECYDCLECITPKLVDDNKNTKQKEEMEEYLNDFRDYVKYLRDLFNEYNNGESIGDYAIQYRIEQDVSVNRDVYMNMIKVFFKIFGEES